MSIFKFALPLMATLAHANPCSKFLSDKSPWASEKQIIYRGIRIQGKVNYDAMFERSSKQLNYLPIAAAELRDIIIKHKDGLRSQGDGVISATTDLAVATMFSDTTYSGGTGLIIKMKNPPNNVSLSKFAEFAEGKPYDHGGLHGFEYEREVILPNMILGDYVIEVLEVVPSGDRHVLRPYNHDSINYPFAVKRTFVGQDGRILTEPIRQPRRLPIYYSDGSSSE